MARRVGRRPGKQDTRGAIIKAAREAFAEHGYDGTSIRMIATAAGVDPALVHHYFEGKNQLFLETVRPPVNPSELIPKIVAGGVDGLGERIVDTFTGVWENPATGPAFEALLRHSFANRMSGRLVREFFAVQVIRRATQELEPYVDPAEIPLRANLVVSQLFGLASMRYILKLEPLASTPRETVIAAVGPNVQRYLTGDLPGP